MDGSDLVNVLAVHWMEGNGGEGQRRAEIDDKAAGSSVCVCVCFRTETSFNQSLGTALAKPLITTPHTHARLHLSSYVSV